MLIFSLSFSLPEKNKKKSEILYVRKRVYISALNVLYCLFFPYFHLLAASLSLYTQPHLPLVFFTQLSCLLLMLFFLHKLPFFVLLFSFFISLFPSFLVFLFLLSQLALKVQWVPKKNHKMLDF